MEYKFDQNLLEACVLSVLSRENACASKIMANVGGIMCVPASCLFVALWRLRKKQCVRTAEAGLGGRSRRYYMITDEGRRVLLEACASLNRAVDVHRFLSRSGQ
jgi:DNA-binding PadR family transcriptional regulator